MSSAVERVPDVRRGDSVRVRIISNGLTLTAQAMASEPGYLNGPVRVLTAQTKRELSGKLVSTGVVEVKL
jgi:flagella basal body P-ring formation protein FlgA